MPKLINLAYEISKTINTKKNQFNKAYFGWVKFEIDPSKIAEIKNKIESFPEILRFLIIKTVKENTIHTPKVPMFKKENKDQAVGEIKNQISEEKAEISEEEIDKSIDDLIVN
jgi:hypothetical protein